MEPDQQQPQQPQQPPPDVPGMMQALHNMIQEMRREMMGHIERLDERVTRRAQETQQLHRQMPPVAQQVELPTTIKLPKLEKVNGRNPQVLRQFLRDVEGHMQLNRLDPESQAAVFYASRHFEGDLADWFAAEQHRANSPYGGYTSYTAMAETILRQFGGRDPREEARDALQRAVQTSTVAKFAAYMRRYIIMLPDRADADNRHTFIRGLKPEIALEVAKMNPAGFDAAVEAAGRVEAQLASATRTKHGRRTRDTVLHHLNYESDEPPESGTDSDDELEAQLLYLQKKIEKKKKDLASQKVDDRQARFRKEGRCFHCEEVGHLARNCPKKRSGNS